jgi:hypothetical protein
MPEPIHSTAHWTVVDHQQSLTGAAHHWLLVPHAPATDFAGLSAAARADWWAVLDWLREHHAPDFRCVAVSPGEAATHVVMAAPGQSVRFTFDCPPGCAVAHAEAATGRAGGRTTNTVGGDAG